MSKRPHKPDKEVACPECHGEGGWKESLAYYEDFALCPFCNGEGTITRSERGRWLTMKRLDKQALVTHEDKETENASNPRRPLQGETP